MTRFEMQPVLTRLRLSILAVFALWMAAFPASAATVGDDGLHKQPWFSLTFKDVREDLETAKADGKRLALIVEQRGCIYCRKLHEEVFSNPKIAAYIAEHFMVVQYNMYGDEPVIDLDGEELAEKNAVRRWGLLFTPTVLFLPEQAPDSGTVGEVSVARMPGAFGKNTVRHMFEWVLAKGYAGEEPFQAYHARRLKEEQAQ